MRNRLPETYVILWMAILGCLIWGHASRSQQPPIYDALSYYQKAYNFWSVVHERLHERRLFNPLSVMPSFRPPGTVLMSYPFGFDPDPRGFYFRSVFFPAILLIAAVFVAGYECSGKRRARWPVALVAVFFSTLPMLYHFEFGPNNLYGPYWGLVDGFLTGTAALAIAAGWRSLLQRSRVWVVTTGLLSILCILIKPSGVLVAAAVGLTWAGLASVPLLGAWRSASERRKELKWLATGAVIIGGLDVLVVVLALFSSYLGAESMAFGRATIAVMRAELAIPIWLLWPVIHRALGELFLLWVGLAILVVGIGMRAKLDARLPRAAAVAALLPAALGMWFWLIESGGATEARYGVPFFIGAAILLIPTLMRSWEHAPRALVGCMTALTIIAPTNLGLLLLQKEPPSEWQRLAGVALARGQPSGDVEQLKQLADAPWQRPATVYSFDTDVSDAVFSSFALQHETFHPEEARLSFRRPLDWVRPTAFRIDELVSSDYLLFAPQRDETARAAALADASIDSIERERAAFIAWATSLTSAGGVDTLFESSTDRVLRVRDSARLHESLLRMVFRHRWRPKFIAANAGPLGTQSR